MADDFPPACALRAWRPDVPGVTEVLHASIVGFAYPAHCHDTWTVLIIDDGAVDFRLDRRPRLSDGGSVTVLPPGVAHDGRPAAGAPSGFRKRCVYLDEAALPLDLVGRAVDRTNLVDAGLRRILDALHRELAGGPDRLATDAYLADAYLALATERIGRHLRPAAERAPEPAVARRLREQLDADLVAPPALADAAAACGRSIGHLVRSFTRSYGVSPHAYVTGRRIDAARRLLLNGCRPADVAVAVGFYDEAHLARHFRRHLPVSPGRFARAAAATG